MAVREAGSNKIADHYFVVKEQIKSNEGIPELLKRIYKAESTKQNLQNNKLSSAALFVKHLEKYHLMINSF